MEKIVIYTKTIQDNMTVGYILKVVDGKMKGFMEELAESNSPIVAGLTVVDKYMDKLPDGSTLNYVWDKTSKVVSARKSSSEKIQDLRDSIRVKMHNRDIKVEKVGVKTDEENVPYYDKLRDLCMNHQRKTQDKKDLVPVVLYVPVEDESIVKHLGAVKHRNAKGRFEWICSTRDKDKFTDYLSKDNLIKSGKSKKSNLGVENPEDELEAKLQNKAILRQSSSFSRGKKGGLNPMSFLNETSNEPVKENKKHVEDKEYMEEENHDHDGESQKSVKIDEVGKKSKTFTGDVDETIEDNVSEDIIKQRIAEKIKAYEKGKTTNSDTKETEKVKEESKTKPKTTKKESIFGDKDVVETTESLNKEQLSKLNSAKDKIIVSGKVGAIKEIKAQFTEIENGYIFDITDIYSEYTKKARLYLGLIKGIDKLNKEIKAIKLGEGKTSVKIFISFN